MKRTLRFVDAAKQRVVLNIECEDREKGNHVVRDWETLEPVTDGGTFSISGDCAGSCGQCYDEIVPTPTQKKLIDFWKTYHLNTLQAGTRKQMEALARIRPKLEAQKKCSTERYDIQKRYLRFIGLLNDRGYEYGTEWLFRSYPKEELDKIIADIEAEDMKRREALYEQTEWEVDDPAHEKAIINWIIENMDCPKWKAYKYLALAQECNLEVVEIADIRECEYNQNTFIVQGIEYYAGTDDELENLAREYLNDSDYLWIEAVQAKATTKGLDDWIDDVINFDGPVSVLNTYDGRSNEYDFVEYGQPSIIVCRA